jgi:hypothetical protein
VKSRKKGAAVLPQKKKKRIKKDYCLLIGVGKIAT